MKKSENPRLYIIYKQAEQSGRAIDPSNRWSSREDGYRQLTVKSIHKTEPANCFFFDSIEVDEAVLNSKTVFLVIVRYSDGDTFGTTHGYHYFYSVRTTGEEVEEDKLEISKPSKPGVYRPWDGYFSSLEDIEVEFLPLMP